MRTLKSGVNGLEGDLLIVGHEEATGDGEGRALVVTLGFGVPKGQVRLDRLRQVSHKQVESAKG